MQKVDPSVLEQWCVLLIETFYHHTCMSVKDCNIGKLIKTSLDTISKQVEHVEPVPTGDALPRARTHWQRGISTCSFLSFRAQDISVSELAHRALVGERERAMELGLPSSC